MVYDFKMKAESRLKVSKCRRYYKYKEKDGEMRVFQKEGINWNEIEEHNVIEVEWIRRFRHNNQIIIISTFEIEATPPNEYLASTFNEQIKIALQEGKVIAEYNASVKNNMMGYWVIIDMDKNILIEKELFAKEWKINTSIIAEAVILLDMIQAINDKSYNIMNLNMIIVIDNKAVWKMIYRGIEIPNQYNQDTAVEASVIERIIQ